MSDGRRVVVVDVDDAVDAQALRKEVLMVVGCGGRDS
jgi:hypothetical protein